MPLDESGRLERVPDSTHGRIDLALDALGGRWNLPKMRQQIESGREPEVSLAIAEGSRYLHSLASMARAYVNGIMTLEQEERFNAAVMQAESLEDLFVAHGLKMPHRAVLRGNADES